MRKNFTFLISILLVLFTLSCSDSEDTSPVMPEIPEIPEGADKILIIGNSLTYYNKQPEMFEKMVKSTGRDVFVHSVARMGEMFYEHANNEITEYTINYTDWDYVILQDGNFEIVNETAHNSISESVTKLESQIKTNNPDTEIIFFLYYSDNSISTIDGELYDYYSFQELLIEKTLKFLEPYEFKIAPVGPTWRNYISDDPEVYLWSVDHEHPSEYGSYLMSCVYYSTIYENPSEDISYFSGLEENVLKKIQEVSTETVLNNKALWKID